MDSMITLREASALCGLSVGHLRRLVHAGRVKGARRGERLIVVSRADIDALDKPLNSRA